MATELLSPPRPPRKSPEREPDQFIDRQLRRTQLQVRLVDLVASLVVWLVAVLAGLLLVALCDHWVVTLGTFGRWLALVALVGGSGYYFAVQLGPLVLRRINSAYAAKVIEDAEPSLKNSLLNFLLLRGNPAGVPEVVVDALRERAASDLTRAPVDQAVDRAPLIRLGYVLCGVMVVFAAYKLLSPKDPFRTVARVLAPWADISKPSRVHVGTVSPGNTQVYQGQTVTVTAEVLGLRGKDGVELVYSTADGQTANASVPMSHAAGSQFTCQLPPGPSDSGIQQDLLYRVKAGDAESPQFRLEVLPSPRIEVERVELHYPAYTRRAAQTLEHQGDVRAVEGTQVVIHAKANQEIATAYIEFDPSADGPVRRTPTLAMKAEGTTATAEFRLERLRDGTARHTTYQVRLLNRANLKNDRPTLHRIEALADLAPEIEVLSPMERRLELPVDRTLKVELRGRDPDFGLCKVELELSKGEQGLPGAVLLENRDGQLGPQKLEYLVSPKKLGLQAGDDLILVGLAEDNRHNAAGELEPNISRTDRYVIHITAPEARENKPGEKPMNDAGGGEKPPPEASKPGEREKPNPGDKTKPEKPEKNPGDKPEKPSKQEGDKGTENSAGGKKNEENKPGETGDDEEKPGEKSSGEKKKQNGGGAGGGKSEKQEEGEDDGEGSSSGSEGQSGSKSTKNSAGSQGTKSTGGDSSDKPESGDSSNSGNTGNTTKPQGGQKNARKPSGGGDKSTDTTESTSEGSDSGEQQEGSTQSKPGTPNSNTKAGERRNGEEGEAEKAPKYDADAVEKINDILNKNPSLREKLEEQNKKQGGQNQNSGDKPGNQTKPEGAGGKQEETGENGPQEQPGEQTGAGQPMPQQGTKPGEKPQPGKTPMQGEPNKGENATGNKSEDQGTGAGSNNTPKPMNTGGQQPKEGPDQKKPGEGDQGSAGSGQKPMQPNQTGQPNRTSRDKEKNPKNDNGENSGDSPSANSDDKRQSDSAQGESEGDKSGSGKQGGGQSAKNPGRDAPGSTTSSDEGAGKSNDEGDGETGTKGGKGPKSERPTGKPGSEEGAGSKSQPGGEGTKPDPTKAGGKDGSKSGPPTNLTRDPNKGRPSGDPVTGGGKASEGEPIEGASKKVDIADTEAENLEFAKKSTDLALKYLKDQKDNPDPELLKKLGWSKDDMNAFLQRWEAMKNAAKEGGEAKDELNDAYRSLGLRPAGDKRRSAGAGDDASRNLRDAGGRSEPPPGYAEQFKAFRKSAGQK